jgi:hypothetical protein
MTGRQVWLGSRCLIRRSISVRRSERQIGQSATTGRPIPYNSLTSGARRRHSLRSARRWRASSRCSVRPVRAAISEQIPLVFRQFGHCGTNLPLNKLGPVGHPCFRSRTVAVNMSRSGRLKREGWIAPQFGDPVLIDDSTRRHIVWVSLASTLPAFASG